MRVSNGRLHFSGRVLYYRNRFINEDFSFDGNARLLTTTNILVARVYVDVNNLPGEFYEKHRTMQIAFSDILESPWIKISDIKLVGDRIHLVLTQNLV